LTVIDGKNFPFFEPFMESLGEKSEKTWLTEFSGVPAYTPYHRFRRAIAYVNSGKFRVKTEAEQQVWNECSRLIANAVIYYNSVLLSRVYEQKRAAGDQEALEIVSSSLAARQSVWKVRIQSGGLKG
jgi:Tn3 transposase DDE domain-containing protein